MTPSRPRKTDYDWNIDVSKSKANKQIFNLLPTEKAVVRIFCLSDEQKKEKIPKLLDVPDNSTCFIDDDTVSTIGFCEAHRVKRVYTEEHCIAMRKMDIISVDEGTIVLGLGNGHKSTKKVLKFKSISEARNFVSYFKA